jgi:hypothetical protein
MSLRFTLKSTLSNFKVAEVRPEKVRGDWSIFGVPEGAVVCLIVNDVDKDLNGGWGMSVVAKMCHVWLRGG